MFSIKNNLLFKDGVQVEFIQTPNKSGIFTPEFLIMHYTAATTAESTKSWFKSKEAQVSAHLLIDRVGNVTQFAPFNVVTWHAGQSEWKGEILLNDNAIGIEFVNGGILQRGENLQYICPVDKKPVFDVVKLTNVRGLVGYWQQYTVQQIRAGVDVANAIKEHYNIKEVLGHEDVSPGRKTDPGPAFPWKQFKNTVNSITTADVNIRAGYSTDYEVLKVVKKDSEVKILNTVNGWYLVELQDAKKLKGWINSKYIR